LIESRQITAYLFACKHQRLEEYCYGIGFVQVAQNVMQGLRGLALFFLHEFVPQVFVGQARSPVCCIILFQLLFAVALQATVRQVHE
jgi:hypothetical protein